MPDVFATAPAVAQPAKPFADAFGGAPTAVPSVTEDSSGPGWGTAAAVGGAGLAALLASSPTARAVAKTGLKGLNSARMQLMLSGYALPKSVMGGLGAVGEAVIEGAPKTAQAALPGMQTSRFAPLRELFSMQSLRDLKDAYQSGGHIGPTPGVASHIPSPGKAMGAFDQMFSHVLQRAGRSPKEAQSAMLQAPIGKIGEVLESPVASAVHPFRRQGVNSFVEGWDKIKNVAEHKGPMAAYVGAGAAHGALTADDRNPVSVPFGIAASARYGVPYGLAALAGRGLMGAATGGNIGSSLVPFSEYATEQIRQPIDYLKPFVRPGIAKVVKDAFGE